MKNDAVLVEHKILQGRHVFFAPGVGGLYVADRDENRARAKVTVAIETMKRHGVLAPQVGWTWAETVHEHVESAKMGFG